MQVVVHSRRAFSDTEKYCLSMRLKCRSDPAESTARKLVYYPRTSAGAISDAAADIKREFGFLVSVVVDPAQAPAGDPLPAPA